MSKQLRLHLEGIVVNTTVLKHSQQSMFATKYIISTHLFYRLQCSRCDLYPDEPLHGLGEQSLVVAIWVPCPPCFLFRERNIVPGLHCATLEETQLGPFEGHADRLAEASGQHGSWVKREIGRLVMYIEDRHGVLLVQLLAHQRPLPWVLGVGHLY
jgi:hypothetical protein